MTRPDRDNGDVAGVCFLFENRRSKDPSSAAFLFENPVRRIMAGTGDALLPALAALEEERERGRYVCGYLAYEAGAIMVDPGLYAARTLPDGVPLLDFFSFDGRRCLSADDSAVWLSRAASGSRTPAIFDVVQSETGESYRAKIAAIQGLIASGDTYQVNFTLKVRFGFQGSAAALYSALRDRQRVEFGAYIGLPGLHVLSFSPELFVRRDGDELTAKPMKGTAARGLSASDDERIVSGMRGDAKTLSENVMIVDLIRSDVGRIADVGSVSVEGLFDVETFETVHQMVSTVRGKVPEATAFHDVIASLFPCGSITGAPKRRTMEIIRDIEAEPRGIYTGAIGFVAPSKEFCFSVPIRTIVVRGQSGEMGIGSGIVHESDAEQEFDECALKGSFFLGVNSSFRLIETMRYEAQSRMLHDVEAHLGRMRQSAAYFAFAFDRARVVEQIERVTSACDDGLYKVRVTLAQDGGTSVSAEALVVPYVPTELPWVGVSEFRIDSGSCFQRHKTTERRLYDDEYVRWQKRGAYDVVFTNERGEIAEASRHNVFIEKEGRLVTPPLDAGALGGIERQAVLADAARRATEERVTLSEFQSANRIFLTNSVRGVVPVVIRALAADAG